MDRRPLCTQLYKVTDHIRCSSLLSVPSIREKNKVLFLRTTAHEDVRGYPLGLVSFRLSAVFCYTLTSSLNEFFIIITEILVYSLQ